jgi:hypothetical protein
VGLFLVLQFVYRLLQIRVLNLDNFHLLSILQQQELDLRLTIVL